jgi:hypothetical protein
MIDLVDFSAVQASNRDGRPSSARRPSYSPLRNDEEAIAALAPRPAFEPHIANPPASSDLGVLACPSRELPSAEAGAVSVPGFAVLWKSLHAPLGVASLLAQLVGGRPRSQCGNGRAPRGTSPAQIQMRPFDA